ncbi:hypothetical protein D3C87_1939510 [compost metagenome]
MTKMAGVRKRVCSRLTPPPSRAANRPERSATAAPSMTTSTSPNGGKLVKVLGMSTSSRATLASDNRLWA